MTALIPAAELAPQASKPYPNDSAACRAARTALLAEEIERRRHLERVAAQRRALPAGGEGGRRPPVVRPQNRPPQADRTQVQPAASEKQ